MKPIHFFVFCGALLGGLCDLRVGAFLAAIAGLFFVILIYNRKGTPQTEQGRAIKDNQPRDPNTR